MRRKPIQWMTRVVSLPASLTVDTAVFIAPPEPSEIEIIETIEIPQEFEIPVPDLRSIKSPKMRAEFLLHTAAEIEHALMIQYLSASFSLGPPFEGPFPGNAISLANAWRRSLLSTAREEMGHLMTVQNLLRLIGGRINLEREDFPFRSDLYPFPFTVEPLSPISLAKYIAAEMPHVDAPTAELQEIIEQATAGAGMPVNRVGILYANLAAIFSSPQEMDSLDATLDPWRSWVRMVHAATSSDFAESEQHLSDDDFLSDSEAFQASPNDWGGDSRVFVRMVHNREQALAAIREIALQGEGLPPGEGPSTESHFQRFMTIRGAFPLQGQWKPARSIAINPALPEPNEPPEPNTITNPRSQRWARLFNVRYAILLFTLAHFLETRGSLYVEEGQEKGDRTPRGFLHLWVFNEMRHLHKIGRKLSQLPRREDTSDPARAGAPFTLPATLDLPESESARWELHHNNFRHSSELIAEIVASGSGDETDPFLEALRRSDDEGLRISETQIAGSPLPPQPTEFQKAVLILDESVRGLPFGIHGAFWRDIGLQEFLTLRIPPVDLELLIVGNGDESNLIQVLRGVHQTVPQMPRRRPPVPPSRIAFLKEWIDRHCPDNDPPNQIGIHSEPVPNEEPPPA